YVGFIGENWIGALGERLSTSPGSAGGKSYWLMVVDRDGHFVGCAMKGAGSIDVKQVVAGVRDTVYILVETKAAIFMLFMFTKEMVNAVSAVSTFLPYRASLLKMRGQCFKVAA
ncbi:hypothetical protein FOZ62_000218, partial [Perkinsus olseni]